MLFTYPVEKYPVVQVGKEREGASPKGASDGSNAVEAMV